MELEEFSKEFKKLSEKISINIEDEKIEKFYKYMLLIQEWNKKINLTAIIEPKEMIIKHFIDSLTIANQLKNDSKIIDVGTGAGFPGIPIKIYNDSLKITLLDSLNKRTIFLKEVIKELKLENIEVIHGRAEECAQKEEYREKYDYAVSRAVAPLNILLEYLVPYACVNGTVLAMKGSNALEEINNAENALKQLYCEIDNIEKKLLPEESGERYIIKIVKKEKTLDIYPRKAGIPKKKPL
ncbi:MAG: 16S rRNA (guanine(527)-N(7))-methyltransferase RsmG [Clostridia bacterium]|nr:16S rRNA (guanine(527)-N(7))-methyltransferase RsmG [Clostridia bacterium]